MRHIRWLVTTVFIAAVALLWWRANQPPISFVPIETFVPKHVSIRRNFYVGVFQCEIETAEGKKWRWTAKVRERGKYAKFAWDQGFFDIDGDGYEEFFVAKPFDALWVFKRQESVKVGRLFEQKLPSWFPPGGLALSKSEWMLLYENQWVLWSKIPIDFEPWGLTFIAEPNSQQPCKVVLGGRYTSPNGNSLLCLLLSPDGRRLIPFAEEWTVKSVEDLDHDGICELVLEGRVLVARAAKAIYKWDGKTYRLWWMPEKRDGYLLDAILCDLDGDGTKEIVALLDLKGSVNALSPFRALAVYRLERGRYRKVTQLPLPKDAQFVEWGKVVTAAIPTQKGAIIALEFDPPEWRLFVGDRLPSPLRRWYERFCQQQRETWWLVGDGKNVRVQNRWRGMTPSGVWGASGKAVWFDLEGQGYHAVVASVNGRCYPVWWGKASALMGGDWDGNGDDELIVWEKDKGKLTVFKTRWRKRW
jgi:hypothetical protein